MSTFVSRVVGLIEMESLSSHPDALSCRLAAPDTSLAQWFERQQRPHGPEPQSEAVSSQSENTVRPIDRSAPYGTRDEDTLPGERLAASVPTFVTADLRCLAEELNLETRCLTRRLHEVALSKRLSSGALDT